MFAWMISENLPAQKSQSSRFAEAKVLVSLFLSWAVNSLKTGHITHLCFPHSTQNNVLVTFNVKTFIGDSFYLRSFRPQFCFWRVFPEQRARARTRWAQRGRQGWGEPGTALMLHSLGPRESQSCRKQVKVSTHNAGARPELDGPKGDVPDDLAQKGNRLKQGSEVAGNSCQ